MIALEEVWRRAIRLMKEIRGLPVREAFISVETVLAREKVNEGGSHPDFQNN